MTELTELLAVTWAKRESLVNERHDAAFRALNGFYEGWPDLAIDIYARTAVIHNYAEPPESAAEAIQTASEFLRAQAPWLQAIVVKPRKAATPEERKGRLVWGERVDRRVREHGVWYALDLLLNRDVSLFLDTRHLRAWAKEHLADKSVLNTFAYTGSLGVAAQAAGARRVVHLDKNREFLNIAKDSYSLNGFPVHRTNFLTGDFWAQVAQLKRGGELFDCVFLDPPFFAESGKGVIDLNHESDRMINKVRPLVGHEGYLVAINNALFVSGADYYATLQNLCADGYMTIEELAPVPEDFTGYPATVVRQPPVDPAPFNHATKIAVLRVQRKDGKTAR